MHRSGPRGLGRSYLDGFRAALASPTPTSCARWTRICRTIRSSCRRCLHAIARRRGSGDRIALSGRAAASRTGRCAARCSARSPTYTSAPSPGCRCATAPAVIAAGARTRSRTLQLDVDCIGRLRVSHRSDFSGGRRRHRIAEVPIVFVERRQGASKLSSSVLLESLKTPWRLAQKTAASGPPTHPQRGRYNRLFA